MVVESNFAQAHAFRSGQELSQRLEEVGRHLLGMVRMHAGEAEYLLVLLCEFCRGGGFFQLGRGADDSPDAGLSRSLENCVELSIQATMGQVRVGINQHPAGPRFGDADFAPIAVFEKVC